MYKYIRYFTVLILSYLILKIGKVYNYFIIHFRHKARYVVYNYIDNNDLFFFYKDNIISSNGNISKLRFLFYFIFVWMWLNDDTDKDCMDSKDLLKIVSKNNNILPDIAKSLHNTKPFSITSNKPVDMIYKKLSIDYQAITNYAHFFYYTTNTKLVFTKKFYGYLLGYEPTNKYYNGRMVYKLILRRFKHI